MIVVFLRSSRGTDVTDRNWKSGGGVGLLLPPFTTDHRPRRVSEVSEYTGEKRKPFLLARSSVIGLPVCESVVYFL